MRLLKRFRVLLVAIGCIVSAVSISAQAVIGLERGPEAPHLLKDQPAEAFRLELIDLAWQAATSYPINPHIKNRGRAEEIVVNGALGIDQPHLAWGYAKQVVNWRKGACYAEIAAYLLEQRDADHVEYFFEQALRHSNDPKQGWRHEKVKSRVEQLRVLMVEQTQEQESAASRDTGSDEASTDESGDTAEQDQVFAQQVKALDDMVNTEGYEAILAAMFGYADLYAKHYADPERRELLLDKTQAAWTIMPGIHRFGVVLQMADAALAHEDMENADALVTKADKIRQSFSWNVDYELRLQSDIARYRVKLGQIEAAREMLGEAVALADRDLEKLQNFNRAAALRPVAEAYAALGEQDRALQLYQQVVELGSENPNLRPRIKDITATCVSMALHNIEPDAELLSKIQQIVDGLKK